MVHTISGHEGDFTNTNVAASSTSTQNSTQKPIQESKWKHHKITVNALWKIPLAVVIGLIASPLLLVAGMAVSIGAVAVNTNKRAYSAVVDFILLDSRKIKENEADVNKPSPETLFEKLHFKKVIEKDVDDFMAINFRGDNVEMSLEEANILARVCVLETLIENGVSKDAATEYIGHVDIVERKQNKKKYSGSKDTIKINTNELSSQIKTIINSKLFSEMKLFEEDKININEKVALDTYKLINPAQRGLKPADQKWIVFHLAKGDCYEHRLDMLQEMGIATGANILVYNYRGVSGSKDESGEPVTEANLVSDGIAVVESLKILGVRNKNMMMMGHSQGGAVAAQVAADYQGDQNDSEGYMHLAVMHTYRKYSEAASQLVPLGFGAIFAKAIEKRWKFDSEKALKAIKGHVITVENKEDRIVKTRLAVEGVANRAHVVMTPSGDAASSARFVLSPIPTKKGIKAHEVTIYDDAHENKGTKQQFTQLVKNALWPLGIPPTNLPANSEGE